MGSDQTPYIPIHMNLWDHPKTRRLARELGIGTEEAGLRLIRLWQWAFVYAPDGNLRNFSTQDIADGAHYIGDPDHFTDALDRSGYSTDLILHDWNDYAGKMLAQRKRSAEYMRGYRKSNVSLTQQSRECKEERRGEERRESEQPARLLHIDDDDPNDNDRDNRAKLRAEEFTETEVAFAYAQATKRGKSHPPIGYVRAILISERKEASRNGSQPTLDASILNCQTDIPA